METSIINLFQQGLSWDIFAQGFIFNVTLIFSFIFFMYLVRKEGDETILEYYFKSLKKIVYQYFSVQKQTTVTDGDQKTELNQIQDTFSNNIMQSFKFITLSGTLIISSYITGAMVVNLSDKFMDECNAHHLGLKKYWVEEEFHEKYSPKAHYLTNTDKIIKLKTFDKILGKYVPNDYIKNKDKLKTYYYTKHAILGTAKWVPYLQYTQTLINLNQTLCFSFWVMSIVALIGLLVTLIITFKEIILAIGAQKVLFLFCLFNSLLVLFFACNICFENNTLIAKEHFSVALFSVISLTIIILQLKIIESKIRLKTSLILLLFSMTMYLFSAQAWQSLEKESCDKTYGIFEYCMLKKGEKLPQDYVRDMVSKNPGIDLEKCLENK
ncbi:hypothetical protein G4D82_12450 [Flavobacterium sp. CYK-4]|uniref:hypothetical protein n=1 Tax=Flavobacterium lotistagni TaxID=2709660 RepID=UPI00140E3770|nr:hypothetical protein [Flavobacterium lotistagni]NHM08034.1 hypothetical protein [Flavobacterium lotistagni]